MTDGRAATAPHGAHTRGTVVIATERCKGCELCVPACPPNVLTMSAATNTIGFRYPVLAPGCTGCRACNDVCPDFVFEVYRFERAVTDSELLDHLGSGEQGEQ